MTPKPLAEYLASARRAGEEWIEAEALVNLAEGQASYHRTPDRTMRLQLARDLARRALNRFSDAVRRAEIAGLSAAASEDLMLQYSDRLGFLEGALGMDMAPGFAFPPASEGGDPCSR